LDFLIASSVKVFLYAPLPKFPLLESQLASLWY